MKEWVPIVKKQVFEPFVDEAQAQSIVTEVFLSIGLMVFAGVIGVTLYWAYNKDHSIFIALVSALTFVFSVKMVILVAVLRKKLKESIFMMYMGSSVFMSLLSLFGVIYFAIAAASSRKAAVSNYSYSYKTAPSTEYS
jgi:hypothetical protein